MTVTELDGRAEQLDAQSLPAEARSQPATDLAGVQVHAGSARISAGVHVHGGQLDETFGVLFDLSHHLEAIARREPGQVVVRTHVQKALSRVFVLHQLVIPEPQPALRLDVGTSCRGTQYVQGDERRIEQQPLAAHHVPARAAFTPYRRMKGFRATAKQSLPHHAPPPKFAEVPPQHRAMAEYSLSPQAPRPGDRRPGLAPPRSPARWRGGVAARFRGASSAVPCAANCSPLQGPREARSARTLCQPAS